MKILPDYIIQYLPVLEEVLEELRLSVLDHAYELLKRLDIDELSSDEIRQKLELYNIKIDNMTKEWLPNGRFYRLYPSIKHHRTRQNTIKAIAKSGGQFEGLWSNDFSNKTEYNFNKIQIARHYEFASDADGYFYVSGDTITDGRGTVISSAAKALSTDILINQSLPAGYTYLYIPWPRPVYPGDSGFFYSVHMLMYDRLYYTEDCNDDSYTIADLSTPASTHYNWREGIGTPYRTPYWFDYHYMHDSRHTEPNALNDHAGTWPIEESGYYYDKDGIPVADPAEAVLYKLDNKCKQLSDSKSEFQTNCYLYSRNKTTVPNRLQVFTPKELISSEEFEYTIDANKYIEYKYVNQIPDSLESPGAYRWDLITPGYHYHTRESLHHIKTYKPFWNESSPWLAMAQSTKNSYNNGNWGTNNHSLYHWMHLKQEENVPNLNSDSYYIESVNRFNEPPVSEITFGSYDRPTAGKLDPIFVGYFNNTNIGNDKVLSTDSPYNNIFYRYDLETDSAVLIENDVTLSYNIVSLNNESDTLYDNVNPIIKCEPFSDLLYVDLNAVDPSETYSYSDVLYKTSKINKLYVNSDKSSKEMSYLFNTLYNTAGSSEIYFFDENSTAHESHSLKFTIVGVCDNDGNRLQYNDSAYMLFTYRENQDQTHSYDVTISNIANDSRISLNVSYILFTVELVNTPTEKIEPENVTAISPEGESINAVRITNANLSLDIIDVGNGYITIEQFYEEGYSFGGISSTIFDIVTGEESKLSDIDMPVSMNVDQIEIPHLDTEFEVINPSQIEDLDVSNIHIMNISEEFTTINGPSMDELDIS